MIQLIQRVIDMKLMIQWAITSSALILIVLAVRVLFREKLSARLKYALWGVVLLRLLVPFQVELPAAAPVPVLASNLARDVTPWLDDTMLYAVPTEDRPSGSMPDGTPPQYARNGTPGDGWEYYSGGVVYDGGHVTRYAFMLTALEVLVVIWIAGTALTALVVLASNLRFGRRLRKRRERLPHPSSPAAMPPFPEGEGLALRGTEVPVYIAEGLPSPCLFGVLRPAVYVTPRAAEDPDTLRHVLAHELTHYAHKDHIWSLLRCLALALHWYNPLVWLAVALSKQDGELACDEGVVARLGEGERIPYGRTLVDMVANRSLRPADLLSCSTAMTGGKKSIQLRVAQIVKKPETVKAALFAVIAVVALAAVFVFAGRAQASPSSFQEQFLSELEGATAIRYSPPSYSSTLYSDPITDEDLLSQAKEKLASLVPVPSDSGLVGASTLIHTSRVSLTGPAGTTVYTLERQPGRTGTATCLYAGDLWQEYLEAPDERGGRPQTIEAGPALWTTYEDSGEDLISALEDLAWQQNRRLWSASTPEDPDFSQYRVRLEAAQGIWLNMPMFHEGRVLTDPEQLERVKGLLALTPLEDRATFPSWDGVWNHIISLTYSPPGPDWSGSGDFYYISLEEDGSYYVLLPTDSAQDSRSGVWLGKIPDGNWEAAEEILQNAPTVDDRQHMAELEENQAAISQALAKALEGCEEIRFQDSSIPDITDPALLEQAKTVLTSGYLIDDMAQTGDGGGNETVEIRGRDGQSLSSFLITNRSIRQQLHDIALNRQLGDLTREQVAQINEAFRPDVELPDGGWGPSEISCFFTSSYDDPTKIDLEEFLRYCPLAEGVDEQADREEYRDVLEATWPTGVMPDLDDFLLPTPMWRYPREKVSALLEKYTGVTIDRLDWGDMLYLEEYDAFYNFTSDYGPGFFPCAGGQITGDTVRLWSEPDGEGDRCELVLQKSGDSWLIRSHHTIYER